jgi:hypothetical protein
MELNWITGQAAANMRCFSACDWKSSLAMWLLLFMVYMRAGAQAAVKWQPTSVDKLSWTIDQAAVLEVCCPTLL